MRFIVERGNFVEN